VFIQGLFAHIISGPTAWGDSIAPAWRIRLCAMLLALS
jgi:hypothetical protein